MKRALIVIDMQKDFVDGALGSREAEAILPAVCERISQAVAEGDWVAYTMDTHGEDYLATQEGERLPVPHCVEGTAGWELHAGVRAALPRGAAEFRKGTFGSVRLAEELPGDIQYAELIGLCTDICVISNAMLLKAFRPELRIGVNAACCAGVTPQSHETALCAMQGCQIDIFN